MIIKSPHIIIENINKADLEELRNVRNENRMYLIDDRLIEKDEQKKWFFNIDKDITAYYKFYKDYKTIGFIYVTEIDNEKKSFKSGILTKKEYVGTSSPALAAIILGYYYFSKLGFESMYTFVHRNNKLAINFNLDSYTFIL